MGAPVDSLESRNPGIEFTQQAAAIASTAIHLAGASSMPLKPRNIIKQVCGSREKANRWPRKRSAEAQLDLLFFDPPLLL
jgi:hypothetical protein